MAQVSGFAERSGGFGLEASTPRSASHSESRRSSHRLRVALGLFALHLIGAPLLIGGVFAWSIVLIAASALVCLVASAVARSDLRATTPVVFWAMLVMLGWTALQALPLPCGLVAALTPGAAQLATGAREVLYDSPAKWCTLSYDPGATRQEIVKGIALIATFLSAWILSAGSKRRDVHWIVAISALTMSVVAIAHTVMKADKVFGIYAPVEAHAQLLLAPLLNANNLGGFAAVGATLWIGLTHQSSRSEIRWWGRVAAVLTATVAILSLSRGAIAQVLGTLLFLAGYIQIRSRRNRRANQPARWTPGFAVLGTAVVTLALVAYIAGDKITEQFTGSDFNKFALVGRAFGFVAEHPWVGVGRGAFASAFLPHSQGPGVRFGYAENFVAQWASEWGVLFAGFWIAVVSIVMVQRLRTMKSLVNIAAATALLGLCAQNLLDLGFELIGVACVAVALLAVVLSPSELRPRADPRKLASVKTGVAVALVAGFAGLLLLAPRLQADSMQALERRLRSTLEARDRHEFRHTLERAVTLHPGEPVFPIIAATEGLRHDDPKTLRWLNRAMQLAPHWGSPHVLAHQWLWRRGHRRQALLELRLGAERDSDTDLLGQHYCQLATLRGELALAAVPPGKNRRSVLEMTGGCVPYNSRASEVIDAVLLRDFPDSPGALERSAYRVALTGDVDQAVSMFDSLLQKKPDLDSARMARARVLHQAERYEELVRRIDGDLPKIAPAHRPSLVSMQADAYARMRDLDGMRRALESYRRLVGTTVDGLADMYALEGSLQLRLENFGAALTAFHEAYRINGATSHLASLATAARKLGNRSQVLWAYMQLCDRQPTGTTYCEERDRMLAAPAF